MNYDRNNKYFENILNIYLQLQGYKIPGKNNKYIYLYDHHRHVHLGNEQGCENK